ncbi:helix-turn-helix domain-containing protein [Chitinimonas sp.]|uniref:helix-turn-helix domain-containing protein n=1 Tax=Chitinimonas sp. TaxID=1934313 RepID=UPI002F92B52D
MESYFTDLSSNSAETAALSAVNWQPMVAAEPLCTSCRMHGLCLATGRTEKQAKQAGTASKIMVKRGEALYRAGEAFHAIHVVKSGCFKTCALDDAGREQVTGFSMSGELLGLDGIDTQEHQLFAIAQEDSQVCSIPYADLNRRCAEVPALLGKLLQLMSREISRSQYMAMQLGTGRAEARVGQFLLDLSRRFAARGYSAHEFHLRMTREEIGSYLGLKLETVSRTLSRLDELGLIAVHQRHVRIPDLARLAEITQAERALASGVVH